MTKIPRLVIFALVAVCGLLLLKSMSDSALQIKYRGEIFKLSKRYASYEDYKNDPNNLDSNEFTRIERVMTETSIPQSFPHQGEFARAVFKLKFPGYGFSGRGEHPQQDGSTCYLFSVEIPPLAKERFFTGHTVSNQIVVIDDFVFSYTSNQQVQVTLDGEQLRYTDRQGKPLREKRL